MLKIVCILSILIAVNGFGKNLSKFPVQILTPEMFGAKGDGKTDDFAAIQKMLDSGAPGCEFRFDGKKTYYNAFANNGKWTEPLKRNIWQRHAAATFKFNGAKLRRRLPRWNDQNLKGNYNEGAYYTDEQTALLVLTGKNFVIDGADFSSGLSTGTMLSDEEKSTGISGYAVGQGMTLGLWIKDCDGVTITNSSFSHTVFPLYITDSKNITIDNIKLQFAAQAQKRIYKGDPATGAGMKLMRCENVKATRITGYRNANATVEVESLNKNISVQGESLEDYDTSMTIINSENVKIDWTARHVKHGSGLIIVNSEAKQVRTKNIYGSIRVEDTPWCGVLIWNLKNAAADLEDVRLKIITHNNGHAGLKINNEAENTLPKNINLDMLSTNDGWGQSAAVVLENKSQGLIKLNATGKTGIKQSGKSGGGLTVQINKNSKLEKISELAAGSDLRVQKNL